MWIETITSLSVLLDLSVTPHTGVWIETLGIMQALAMFPPVTPHSGVWIETMCHQNVINNCVCFSLAYGVFER